MSSRRIKAIGGLALILVGFLLLIYPLIVAFFAALDPSSVIMRVPAFVVIVILALSILGSAGFTSGLWLASSGFERSKNSS